MTITDTITPDITIKAEPQAELRKMFRCSVCFLEFKDLTDFKSHTCKNEYHKCKMCGVPFRTRRLLNNHIKVHKINKAAEAISKQPDGPFMCYECDTVFPSNKSLR